ncbi:MAG: hypothetical protein IKV82_03840 [Akkermansia sp.]|nr:hypothetical protein [Akkermansia sp.]
MIVARNIGLLIWGLMLGCMCTPLSAETLWAAGVGPASGWKDINKSKTRGAQGDNGLCWAMAAANLIDWWQQQRTEPLPQGTPTGEGVWQVFCTSFTNAGSDPDQAIRWWFTGAYAPMHPTGCARLTNTAAGGYYREHALTQGGDIIHRLLYARRSDTVNAQNLTQALYEGFRRGDAFWIGVFYFRPDGSRYTHSLTVWGVEAENDSAGHPHLTAIYMTDSDDGARCLHRIPIREADGMLMFDCDTHPLYGQIGRITINTYTGMRVQLPAL